MKITNKQEILDSSGLEDSKSFTIKATKESFEALSSSLYKNKRQSIIRELLSNAYDSHVMANNLETPIEITLPHALKNINNKGTFMKTIILNNICNPFFESCLENTKTLLLNKYGKVAEFKFLTRKSNGSYVKSLVAKFNSLEDSKTFLKNEKKYRGGFLIKRS